MKRLYRMLVIVLTLASAVYFVLFAARHFDSLPKIDWTMSSLIWFGASTALYMLTMISAGVGWFLLIRAMREKLSLKASILLLMLGQFAKYLPGGFANHIARIGLARKHGVDVARAGITVLMETAWAIVAAVALALATILFGGSEAILSTMGASGPWTIAATAILAAAVPMAALWAASLWESRVPAAPRPRGRVTVLAACFGLYCFNLVACGAALDVLARALFGASESHILLLTGAFAVAWVIGFISPFAPGGLGVREAVLVAILAPLYGPGATLGIVAVFRLVTTLGDGVAFLIGFAGQQRLPLPSVEKIA